eukprot:SAG31_NODE_231_length_19768_cov_9.498170_13_plen_191_part_00
MFAIGSSSPPPVQATPPTQHQTKAGKRYSIMCTRKCRQYRPAIIWLRAAIGLPPCPPPPPRPIAAIIGPICCIRPAIGLPPCPPPPPPAPSPPSLAPSAASGRPSGCPPAPLHRRHAPSPRACLRVGSGAAAQTSFSATSVLGGTAAGQSGAAGGACESKFQSLLINLESPNQPTGRGRRRYMYLVLPPG